jgi:hypothetical protein
MWYEAQNRERRVRQVVISLPPQALVRPKATQLAASAAFTLAPWAATVACLVSDGQVAGEPVVFAKATDVIAELRDQPVTIAFAFYYLRTGAILQIFVSADAPEIRASAGKPFLTEYICLLEKAEDRRLAEALINQQRLEVCFVAPGAQGPCTGYFGRLVNVPLECQQVLRGEWNKLVDFFSKLPVHHLESALEQYDHENLAIGMPILEPQGQTALPALSPSAEDFSGISAKNQRTLEAARSSTLAGSTTLTAPSSPDTQQAQRSTAPVPSQQPSEIAASPHNSLPLWFKIIAPITVGFVLVIGAIIGKESKDLGNSMAVIAADNTIPIVVAPTDMLIAPTTTQTPVRPTATPTPVPTSEPGIHTDFVRSRAAEIQAVSPMVLEGEIAFERALANGTFEITITGKWNYSNGQMFCGLCFRTVSIAPKLRIPIDLFYEYLINDPTVISGEASVIGLTSQTSKAYTGATDFIVSGPEGATLRKEGKGFILVDGQAYLLQADR